MKPRVLLFCAATLTMAALAHADVHLASSVPADNSVIAYAPSQIELNFSAPIRITALSLQRKGEKEPTRIEVSAKAPANELDIPVTQLGPGAYTLNWRGIGRDNHEAAGTVHFTISGK
jgi:methionine-rich copper-binding protein CopC